MNDKEFVKKEVERMELAPFLDAYRHITGKNFEFCWGSENPDFICKQGAGEKIGIGLTRVMRDPREQFLERILFRKEEPDSYEFSETIFYLIEKKEQARKERYVNLVEDTILVLQIMDGSLYTIAPMIEGIKKNNTFFSSSENESQVTL